MLPGGPDRPEETVLLFRWAGGEEQRVGRAVCGRALAEFERPEAVDQDRPVVRGPQSADALVAPVALRLVGVDLAVTEVADKQIAGEDAP